MLSREQILGMDDLEREEVFIPEWQGSIFVRVMTGEESGWLEGCSFDEQGEVLSAQDRLAHYRGRLAVLTACHADGSSLFVLSDAERLGKKAGKALDRIVEVARRLNRITPEEIETLTKNSVATTDAAPGSASP